MPYIFSIVKTSVKRWSKYLTRAFNQWLSFGWVNLLLGRHLLFWQKRLNYQFNLTNEKPLSMIFVYFKLNRKAASEKRLSGTLCFRFGICLTWDNSGEAFSSAMSIFRTFVTFYLNSPEHIIDHRSYAHNLSSCEIKA